VKVRNKVVKQQNFPLMYTNLIKKNELQSVLSKENETIRGIQRFMQPFTLDNINVL
jgi:hypothetical protein